ncbi:hypothetical protein Tco_1208942, partial [Tanacetum coccineum]
LSAVAIDIYLEWDACLGAMVENQESFHQGSLSYEQGQNLSFKRQCVHELDFGLVGDPDLQVPIYSKNEVVTMEPEHICYAVVTTFINNGGVANASSLGWHTLESDVAVLMYLYGRATATFVDDVTTHTVSSSDDYTTRTGVSLITEYLVNISKRRAFWSLNEDILKIIILKTNTSYPSRKIRRIRATKDHKGEKINIPYLEEVNTPY